MLFDKLMHDAVEIRRQGLFREFVEQEILFFAEMGVLGIGLKEVHSQSN
jgi:hypothetical protein